VARGFYSEQLRRIWRFFPREQTLVLKSETFFSCPGATLKTVQGFLGLSPVAAAATEQANAGRYGDAMPEECRAFLEKTYRWEVRWIEDLLGWDCSDWLA
jgi:hypothetical protein